MFVPFGYPPYRAQSGCTCPKAWWGIYPPPCPVHNPPVFPVYQDTKTEILLRDKNGKLRVFDPNERLHPDGGLLPTGFYRDKDGRVVSDQFTPDAMRPEDV